MGSESLPGNGYSNRREVGRASSRRPPLVLRGVFAASGALIPVLGASISSLGCHDVVAHALCVRPPTLSPHPPSPELLSLGIAAETDFRTNVARANGSYRFSRLSRWEMRQPRTQWEHLGLGSREWDRCRSRRRRFPRDRCPPGASQRSGCI